MAGHSARERRTGKRQGRGLRDAVDRFGEEWFLSYVKSKCRKVRKPRPGDFLLYQYGRCVSHGAVYIGDGRVVHAVVRQGVIMSDTNEVQFVDAKGRSRLRGIYRYNGGTE